MYLTSLRLRHVGPFEDVTLSFTDPEGNPRPTTVILGDSGMGKTTVLAAIATTRPGLCAPPSRPWERVPPTDAFIVARYRLHEEDAGRPHDLVLASPQADLRETAAETTARKREQAHFDKLAAERPGFCLIPLPVARWASRLMAGPPTESRGLTPIEQRAQATMDDAARADFARECKQALVQAVTTEALHGLQSRAQHDEPPHPRLLARRESRVLDSYRAVFQELFPDGETSFEGLEPSSYEPLFRDPSGRVVTFDDLAFGLKNRVLLGTVILRRLALSHPGDSPRTAEGIVLIDEVEAHLPQRRQRELLDALRQAFPRLQIIATTQSPLVLEGRAPEETIMLSRDLESGGLEIAGGAVLH